jgi:hypothetical protein
VAEYNVAGLVDMVIKMQRRPRFAEQLGESALALLGRFPAQVFAAQFEQIKGAQRPPGS